MHIETNLRELDYFAYLRLSDKRGTFHKEGDKAWISCGDTKFVLKAETMMGVDVDLKKTQELTPEHLRKTSTPLAGDVVFPGAFRLVNLEDKYWLFAFIAPPKFCYVISCNSFEKLLDKM
ncbi:hypothetical protein NAD41_000920 [Salmonella enterica]|nr:hypothetical protein [Salmonella enterica]EKK6596303.1 hypothetical protein [Salmonella enterica]